MNQRFRLFVVNLWTERGVKNVVEYEEWLQDRQYWGGFFENKSNQINDVPNVVSVAEEFPPDKNFLF